MIEQSDIPITNIIRKTDNGTVATTRLKEALEETISSNGSQARILFDTYNLGQILFSDKVLIAEGDTEKTVLPTLFHKVMNKSLGEYKLALVIANGANNIYKMMQILVRMGISVKGLADLDYAVVNAKSDKLLEKDDSSIQGCMNVLKTIQPKYEFKLHTNDLPSKCDKYKASEVFELMAEEDDASEYISQIRSKLKDKSIWVWSRGAIEPHLCLEAKTNEEWLRFRERLHNEDIESCVADLDEIRSFFNWCVS